MTDADPPRALSHLRVLDLTRILAGPWASQMLADLGAEVLKIETPDGGDDIRKWGPPFLPADSQGRQDSAYFTATNRNKRSLAIDFSKPEGAELIKALAAECDIVIENFKVGGLAKYGLDYASLQKIKPDIIYCSVTGFGQTGPYAPRAGYDFLVQGMSGLMSVTGLPDDAPGGGPMKVGIALSDMFTGMYAAIAILAAASHRERTGEGQYIDCALLDSQIATLSNQAANYLVGGVVPSRLGNSHPNVVPYQVFAVADGHLIVAVGNERQFARLCGALGIPDVAEDPRFAGSAARVANRAELEALLAGKIAAFKRDDLIALLEKVGVPCGPINTVAEAFADPQTAARGLKVDTHRGDVAVPGVAFPAKLSKTPADYRLAPPELGADTDAVLTRLGGLDAERLAALRKAGVIG